MSTAIKGMSTLPCTSTVCHVPFFDVPCQGPISMTYDGGYNLSPGVSEDSRNFRMAAGVCKSEIDDSEALIRHHTPAVLDHVPHFF